MANDRLYLRCIICGDKWNTLLGKYYPSSGLTSPDSYDPMAAATTHAREEHDLMWGFGIGHFPFVLVTEANDFWPKAD